MDDLITYMGYEWIQIEDETITIGINEEGLDEFNDINKVDLPTENEAIEADEVIGELDTDEGPLNLYCPIEGTVIEVNAAVLEDPNLIKEDCYGDGWLFKVEAKRPKDLKKLTSDLDSDED
jgi:glycine cleavage system H protein